jgi:hypothetical protein
MDTARRTHRLRVGQRLHGCDGGLIGEITGVWPDVGTSESFGAIGAQPVDGADAADPVEFGYSEAMPGEGESYFEVHRPGGAALYVPFSYVEGVSGDVATVSVASDDVHMMQWDAKPDFLAQRTRRSWPSEGARAPE